MQGGEMQAARCMEVVQATWVRACMEVAQATVHGWREHRCMVSASEHGAFSRNMQGGRGMHGVGGAPTNDDQPLFWRAYIWGRRHKVLMVLSHLVVPSPADDEWACVKGAEEADEALVLRRGQD